MRTTVTLNQKKKRRTPLLTERKEHMTRSDPNGTRNIIIEKQS